jgi:hypothetical protein
MVDEPKEGVDDKDKSVSLSISTARTSFNPIVRHRTHHMNRLACSVVRILLLVACGPALMATDARLAPG